MVTFFDPGLMTARLDLQTPQATSDGQGGVATDWVVSASLWGRIEPVSFDVLEHSTSDTGSISHRVWIAFREGVTAGQRFTKGERRFSIKLVRDPDETQRYLVCQCEEEVA